MTSWYWSNGNQQNGPCTGYDLKKLSDEGKITPRTLVWQPGQPDWVPASRVQGLFKGIVPPPIPSVPPNGSGTASPVRPLISLEALGQARTHAASLISDIRSVSFRDEIVPIDATNVSMVLRDYVFWGATLVGVAPLLIATLNKPDQQLTAFALFFALVWGVIFKYFIVRKSDDWFVSLAALGTTGLAGVFLLLWLCEKVLPESIITLAASKNPAISLAGFVLQVGVLEETIKALPVIAYLLKTRQKANPMTAILVGIFSGLGFAAFENMQYGDRSILNSYSLAREFGAAGLVAGVQQAMVTVMLRSLSLVFCHGLWSGIVAYFLVIGHVTGKRRIALFLVGLSVAAVLHGAYNWLLGVQPTFAAFVVAGSFVLFYAYLSKLRLLVPGLAKTSAELPSMSLDAT